MKGNSCYQTMLVCAAIAIALAGQIIAGPTTIPFADDFSFYTNGTPLVNGTNGWYADTDSVVVQSGVEGAIGANSNAAVLPIDTTLSNRFQNVTATNVWTHLYTKVAKYDGTNPPVIDTNATVQFYVNSNGYFVMANGTNWEESQTFQVTNEDEWLTIDIFQDYDNKMWWMFVNGTNLTNSSSLYPLPPKQQMFTNTVYTNSFISFTIPKFTGFDLYNGGGSTSYLSHVTVADVDRLPYVYARPTNIFQNVVPTAPNTQAVLRVISRAMGVSHYSIITNGENWFTLCDNDTGDPLPGNYSSTLTNASTNYILINFRTNDLAVGTPSNAIITLTSPNWGGTTQQIPVRLAIVNLSVSPLLLTNAMLYQGTPYTYTVQVQNVGPGSMAYQIALNDPQGLGIQATPQGDTNNLTSTPQDVLVDFNLPIIQAMPPGGIEDYEAGFFVTSTNDGGVTQSVSMVLAIYSKPVVDDGALLPYPFFYDITIHRGQQPSNITFSIRNNAWDQPRCYLDFRATSDAPWMVCNTSGRSVNGEWVNVPITFDNMTNYPGGVYQGKVHVHSWDGGAPILYSPTNTVIFTNEFSVTLTIISPGKPGGLTASEGTYTDKIRLSWLDTTNAATYRIYKATTSDFAQATILVDGLTELTYDDTNSILPGRYNYYWASAINEYGGEGSTSSMAIGYASLAAPMNVQASDGLYTNKVAITWQTVTGPTGYEVWRNTLNSTSGVNFIKLGTVSSSTTNYDDTTATINVTYYYFVRSITPDIGTFSASDSGWRAACLPPGGVSATKGIYTDKVRISWNAAVNVTYYDVFRATTTNSSSAVLIGSRDASGQSYDDTNVTAGTVYYYWVKSRNNNGSSIFSSRDYGYTKLAAPSGVSATQTHPYHIQVSWNAVSGATSYQVYKSKSSSSSSATLAGETTSRSYLAQDTIEGVNY